jgi:hypothetical protein
VRLVYTVPLDFVVDRDPASLLLHAEWRGGSDSAGEWRHGFCALRSVYLHTTPNKGTPTPLTLRLTRVQTGARGIGHLVPRIHGVTRRGMAGPQFSARTVVDPAWRPAAEDELVPAVTWAPGASGQLQFPGDRGIEARYGEALRLVLSVEAADTDVRLTVTGFALVEG